MGLLEVGWNVTGAGGGKMDCWSELIPPFVWHFEQAITVMKK